MLVNCAQKTQLLSHIEEHIAMLELRINLNAQSIIFEDPLQKEIFYQGETLQAIETILKNGEAESVIYECQLAVNKLSLLKTFLPLIELECFLSLFTNYEQWDIKEILMQLKPLLKAKASNNN